MSKEQKPTVDWLIDQIVTQHSPLIDFNIKRLEQLILAREETSFKAGQRVGQYQAADKMYGDVTQIYMFGDNQTSAKAKSISEWSAVGLLQDCEKFMNENSDAYAGYIKSKLQSTQSNMKENKEKQDV